MTTQRRVTPTRKRVECPECGERVWDSDLRQDAEGVTHPGVIHVRASAEYRPAGSSSVPGGNRPGRAELDARALVDQEAVGRQIETGRRVVDHLADLGVHVLLLDDFEGDVHVPGESIQGLADLLGIPWPQPEWTAADRDLAQAQGWDVFANDEEGRPEFEVNRIEAPSDHPHLGYSEPKFGGDAEVVDLLDGRARRGDDHAWRALELAAGALRRHLRDFHDTDAAADLRGMQAMHDEYHAAVGS